MATMKHLTIFVFAWIIQWNVAERVEDVHGFKVKIPARIYYLTKEDDGTLIFTSVKSEATRFDDWKEALDLRLGRINRGLQVWIHLE